MTIELTEEELAIIQHDISIALSEGQSTLTEELRTKLNFEEDHWVSFVVLKK